jgi:hypothetical protein
MGKRGDTAVDEAPEPAPRRGGLGRLVALVVAAGAGAFVLSKRRQRQLDDVIWEDPRTL